MLQVNEIVEVSVQDKCYLCRNRSVSYRVKLTDQEGIRINICLCPGCTRGIQEGTVDINPHKLIRLLEV